MPGRRTVTSKSPILLNGIFDITSLIVTTPSFISAGGSILNLNESKISLELTTPHLNELFWKFAFMYFSTAEIASNRASDAFSLKIDDSLIDASILSWKSEGKFGTWIVPACSALICFTTPPNCDWVI